MEEMVMTPGDYFAILKRRKWSLILPALLIILAAAAVAIWLPPVYRSTATIVIEEQEIPAEYVTSTVTSFAEQRIQQINQRVMSFSRLLEIIQRFALYPEMKDKRTTEEIVGKMREDTVLEPLSAEVVDRRTGRPTTATIAFSLSYEGKNPQKVQQVANVLASIFLQENLKERVEQVKETSDFLETEMERVKLDLAAIESRVATFKAAHLNELPEMMQINMQGLSTAERNVEVANQQLRSLKERMEYLQIQLASIDPFMEDERGVTPRQQMEELKIMLVNLKERFTDKHPDVIIVQGEIAELARSIEIEDKLRSERKDPPDNPAYITLSAQLASTRAEYELIKRQITGYQREADLYRRRITSTPNVEEEYNTLMNTRANTQAKLNDLHQKLMEARMAQGLEKEQKGERFMLMEPPRLPEKPFKPNRLAIVLIGFVLGVGAGVGFAALREFSDDAVRSADQIEAAVGLEVLTGVPVIKTASDISRRRLKYLVSAAGIIAAVAGAVALFHYQVMDLDVFWAKLMRKIAL